DRRLLPSANGLDLFIAISPDGRWVVGCPWNGEAIKIWDADSGSHVRNLDVTSYVQSAFSPDGRLLATSSDRAVELWSVQSWTRQRSFPRAAGIAAGPVAFSRDSRVLAFAQTPQNVRLVDLSDSRELATLESP